jgi:hypothetical protein
VRLIVLIALLAGVMLAPEAGASPYLRTGIQDDAWLRWGPGSLEERIEHFDRLGVDVVRYTLRWDEIEPTWGDPDWSTADAILEGLRRHGIAPVVTLYGTPRWANRGRSPNWAPTSKWTFAGFARRAAERYPFVRSWLIWNEPNQRRWLRPTSPRVYVQQILNPAYRAIHRQIPGAKVGAGVTAPRGSYGGVSPVAWIRGMGAAGARLDAYAHNPYPLHPRDTPFEGDCRYCETITMASLERLLREVSRAFGRTRIWLTEYGYQTNPPDRTLGVSRALQARYVGEGARRAYAAPRVDMLIHYLYRDEPEVGRWQSGLTTVDGAPKPALRAAMLPLAQVSRDGLTTTLWGRVRPGAGRQRYVLQRFQAGGWRSVGGVRSTGARGFLTRTLRAAPGTRVRLSYPAERVVSPALVVR